MVNGNDPLTRVRAYISTFGQQNPPIDVITSREVAFAPDGSFETTLQIPGDTSQEELFIGFECYFGNRQFPSEWASHRFDVTSTSPPPPTAPPPPPLGGLPDGLEIFGAVIECAAAVVVVLGASLLAATAVTAALIKVGGVAGLAALFLSDPFGFYVIAELFVQEVLELAPKAGELIGRVVDEGCERARSLLDASPI